MVEIQSYKSSGLEFATLYRVHFPLFPSTPSSKKYKSLVQNRTLYWPWEQQMSWDQFDQLYQEFPGQWFISGTADHSWKAWSFFPLIRHQ